jgi:hypothetical protein
MGLASDQDYDPANYTSCVVGIIGEHYHAQFIC